MFNICIYSYIDLHACHVVVVTFEKICSGGIIEMRSLTSKSARARQRTNFPANAFAWHDIAVGRARPNLLLTPHSQHRRISFFWTIEKIARCPRAERAHLCRFFVRFQFKQTQRGRIFCSHALVTHVTRDDARWKKEPAVGRAWLI